MLKRNWTRCNVMATAGYLVPALITGCSTAGNAPIARSAPPPPALRPTAQVSPREPDHRDERMARLRERRERSQEIRDRREQLRADRTKHQAETQERDQLIARVIESPQTAVLPAHLERDVAFWNRVSSAARSQRENMPASRRAERMREFRIAGDSAFDTHGAMLGLQFYRIALVFQREDVGLNWRIASACVELEMRREGLEALSRLEVANPQESHQEEVQRVRRALEAMPK